MSVCKLTPEQDYSEIHRQLSSLPIPNAREIADAAYLFINNPANSSYKSMSEELLTAIPGSLKQVAIIANSGYDKHLLYEETLEPRIFYVTDYEDIRDPVSVTRMARVSPTYVAGSQPVFLRELPQNNLVPYSEVQFFLPSNDTNIVESKPLQDAYEQSGDPIDRLYFYGGRIYVAPSVSDAERTLLAAMRSHLIETQPELGVGSASANTKLDMALKRTYLAYSEGNPDVVQSIDQRVKSELGSDMELIDPSYTGSNSSARSMPASKTTESVPKTQSEVVDDLVSFSGEIQFHDHPKLNDDGTPIFNSFTGEIMREHYYQNSKTNERFDTSVTALKEDYDDMRFDKVNFFREQIMFSKLEEYVHLREMLMPYNGDEQVYEQRVNDYIGYIMDNQGSRILELHPRMITIDLDKYKTSVNDKGEKVKRVWSNINIDANPAVESKETLFFERNTKKPWSFGPRDTSGYGEYDGYGEEGNPYYGQDEFGDDAYGDAYGDAYEDESGEDAGITHKDLTDAELVAQVEYELGKINATIADTIRSWEARASVGTKTHSLMQSIMMEDADRTPEHDARLKVLEDMKVESEENTRKLDALVAKLLIDPALLNGKTFDEKRRFVVKSMHVQGMQGGRSAYSMMSLYKKEIDALFPGSSFAKQREMLYAMFNFKVLPGGYVQPLTYQEWMGMKEEHRQWRSDNYLLTVDGISVSSWMAFGGVMYERIKSEVQALDHELSEIDAMPYYVTKLYEDALTLKASIKARGGIIKTELPIYTDKVVSVDGSNMLKVAGSPDMLVVLPDGKIEIYDFKTMSDRIENKRELYEMKKRGNYTIFRGYDPKKQAEHAFQLQMYAKILEKELGVEVSDILVVPIYVEYASPNNKISGEVSIQASASIRGSHPLTVRLKDHMMRPVKVTQGKGKTAKEEVYADWAEVVQRVKRRFSETQEDLDAKVQEEVDKAYEDKINDKVTRIAQDIRIYIQKEIDKLQSERKGNTSSDRLNRLYTLQTDLEAVQGMEALVRFMMASEEEINELSKRFNTITLEWAEHKNNPDMVPYLIKEFDDLRIYLGGYELLDEIRENVGDVMNELVKSGDSNYDVVINKRQVLATRTHEALDDLMVKRLAGYISKGAQDTAQDYKDCMKAFYTKRIGELQGKMRDAMGDKAKVHLQYKIDEAQAKLESIDKDMERHIRDESTIARELKEITQDIGFIQRYAINANQSSDPIIALYAKMLTYQRLDAELELKRDMITLQRDLDEFLKSHPVGIDTDTYFEPMLELRQRWYTDENGVVKLRSQYEFLSEIGTQEFQVGVDENGKPVIAQLGPKQIMQHYTNKMSELRRNNKYKELSVLRKVFEDWKERNMMPEYLDEYKTWKSLLTKDAIGQAVAARLESIEDRTNELREGVGEMLLNDQDLYELRKLKAEKKELAMEYDENTIDAQGNMRPKTGMEFLMARRYKEYLDGFKQFYNTEENKREYEKQRKAVIVLNANTGGADSVAYHRFIEQNESYELTPAFYARYKRLCNERDLIYTFIAGKEMSTEIHDLLNSHDLDDETFNKKVEDYIEHKGSIGMPMSDNSENYDKIHEVLKHYRIGSEIDNSMIDERTVTRKMLHDLEYDIVNTKREKGSGDEYDDVEAKAREAWFMYADRVKNFANMSVTSAYYAKVAEMLSQSGIDGDMEALEQTDWFQLNHILHPVSESGERTSYDERFNVTVRRKDGSVSYYMPVRSWKTLTYVTSNQRVNNRYNTDRAAQLDVIRQANPGASKQHLETILKRTPWYKMYHDEDGTPSREAQQYWETDADGHYVERKLSREFVNSKINEDYVAKGSYDKNDRLMPKAEMWRNDKYENLKAGDSAMFDFMTKLKNYYETVKDRLPASIAERIGNAIPMLEKSTKEMWSTKNDKGFAGIGEKLMETKNKAGRAVFGSSTEDELREGNKSAYNTKFDDKVLNVPYLQYMEPEQISKNVLHGLAQFAAQVYKREAYSSVLSETRALWALVSEREKRGGQPQVDAMGRKVMDAMAAKAKVGDRTAFPGKNSQMSARLLDFFEMGFYGEANKPIEIAMPWPKWLKGGGLKPVMGREIVRVDKFSDMMMNIASFTQIGGITSAGWIKGAANWLQARTQIHVEKAARQYYSSRAWRDAWIKYTRELGGHMKSLWSDMGKMTNTSLIGQMMDVYDAMQGEFTDKLGNKIAGKTLYKLMSTDTWYANQYLGEYETAVNSMIALLNGYKVVDGKVMDHAAYMKYKAEKAGVDKLSEYEQELSWGEFENIKESLFTSLQLDDKGQLSVKEGVQWTLGSKEDNGVKGRLASINTSLQGAHADANKAAMQRTPIGRLLIMYRKHLFTGLRRRFGRMFANEQLGDMQEGYYRTFFKVMTSNTGGWGKMIINALVSSTPLTSKFYPFKETGLSRLERANMRRATREIAVWIMLGLLISAMALGDDEDDDEVSNMRYTMLYLATRLHKEVGAMVPTHQFVKDNYKTTKNFSAIFPFFDGMYKIALQMGDPFAVYQRDQGIAEKGDSKMWILTRKFFKNVGVPFVGENTNPKVMYEGITQND